MDGDNGVSIKDSLHKGKARQKLLVRQRTCNGCASVVVGLSARQGTYNDGISIGNIKAKFLTLASALASMASKDASDARAVHQWQ
jgi:hypothetical protein